MSQADTVEAVIDEALPAGLFNIIVRETDKKYMAHLSGKMKHHHIRVLVGDRVRVILDPYKGKTTNRIVERL